MLYALVTLFELFRNVDVSYDRTCDKLWEKGNIGGNCEARELMSGDYDVIVCDGFVGNAVLKTLEGA